MPKNKIVVEKGKATTLTLNQKSVRPLQITIGENGFLILIDQVTESFTARLGTDARLEYFAQPSKKNIAQEILVELEGPGSQAKIMGVDIVRGSRESKRKVTIKHLAKKTKSHQYFKNILSDNALSETNSAVQIEKSAHESTSEQTIRNLVLSDSARAIANPHLSIKKPDVTARHGATSGSLDESSINYLASRGVDSGKARQLLIRSFLQDIIEQYP